MRLILIRHAKSSWDDPRTGDHGRPLANRGRKSASAIGQWLRDHEYCPRAVFCSTARRARLTWEGLSEFMPEVPEIEFCPDLYGASGGMMLSRLATAKEAPVAMIGHNPGIGDFAAMIVRNPPHHYDFRRYPTAATLVCDFPVTGWQDIRPATATVVDFVVPRELMT
ncbi:MAG: histidine phosphatase family protein [Rhodobacteraceae bacterium]|nr:histidine phosphatase family protein [Paracoccaceae bacterium]